MLQTDFLNVLTGATITQLTGTTSMDGVDIDIEASNSVVIKTTNTNSYVQIGDGVDSGASDNSGLKITSGCTFQIRTEGGTNKILISDDKGYGSWEDATTLVPTVNGTVDYIAKFTDTNSVGNSNIQENSTDIRYNKTLIQGPISGKVCVISGGEQIYFNNGGNNFQFGLLSTTAQIIGGVGNDLSISSSGYLHLNSSLIRLGGLQTDRVNFIAGNGGAAPATNAWATPTLRYGGTTIMGTPTGWLDVQINGVSRKIPYF